MKEENTSEFDSLNYVNENDISINMKLVNGIRENIINSNKLKIGREMFEKERDNLSIISRLLSGTLVDDRSRNSITVLVDNKRKIFISFDYFHAASLRHVSKSLHAICNFLITYQKMKDYDHGGNGSRFEYTNLGRLKENLFQKLLPTKFLSINSDCSYEEASEYLLNNLLFLFDFQNLVDGLVNFNDDSWRRIRSALITQCRDNVLPFFYSDAPCCKRDVDHCKSCEVCEVLNSLDSDVGYRKIEPEDEDSSLRRKLRCQFFLWEDRCYNEYQNSPEYENLCFHCNYLFSAKQKKQLEYISLEKMIQYVVFSINIDEEQDQLTSSTVGEYLSQIEHSFLISYPSNYLSLNLSAQRERFYETVEKLLFLNKEFMEKRIFPTPFFFYLKSLNEFQKFVSNLDHAGIRTEGNFWFLIEILFIPIFSRKISFFHKLTSSKTLPNNDEENFLKNYETIFTPIKKDLYKNSTVRYKTLLSDNYFSGKRLIVNRSFSLRKTGVTLTVFQILEILFEVFSLNFEVKDDKFVVCFASSTSESYNFADNLLPFILSIVSLSPVNQEVSVADLLEHSIFSSLIRMPLRMQDKLENSITSSLNDDFQTYLTTLHNLGWVRIFFSSFLGDSFLLEELIDSFMRDYHFYTEVTKLLRDLISKEFLLLTMIDTVVFRISRFISLCNETYNVEFKDSQLPSDKFRLLIHGSYEKENSYLVITNLQAKRERVELIDELEFKLALEQFVKYFSSQMFEEDFLEFYDSSFSVVSLISDVYSESELIVNSLLLELNYFFKNKVKECKLNKSSSKERYQNVIEELIVLRNSESFYSKFSSIFGSKVSSFSSKMVSSFMESQTNFNEGVSDSLSSGLSVISLIS